MIYNLVHICLRTFFPYVTYRTFHYGLNSAPCKHTLQLRWDIIQMTTRDSEKLEPARCDVPDKLLKLLQMESKNEGGWLHRLMKSQGFV